MRTLTNMQEAYRAGQVVHLIGRRAAEALLSMRLVRRTVIDPPAPRGKIAVNLTTKGKTWTKPSD